MARRLDQTVPDIGAPDVNRPEGYYLNEDAGVPGTPILAELKNDVYYFFSRMMSEAGVSFNNITDDINNSQFFESLEKNILKYQDLTVLDLRSLTGRDGFSILSPKGYSAVGDIAGIPSYIWDAVSVLDDNGGSVIKPDSILPANPGRWVFPDDIIMNVLWFGAVGDGVADDTIPIQNAIDVNGAISSPPGFKYLTTTGLEYTGVVHVDFNGSKIIYTGSGDTIIDCLPNSETNYSAFTPFSVSLADRALTLPAGVTAVVGDVVVLESDDLTVSASEGDYLKGQYLKVTSVSGQDITFYPPIVEDFTVDRIDVYGKTEGSIVRNLILESNNVSNNSHLTLRNQSNISISNISCIGSGSQNVGISANGVDIKIFDCTVSGVTNGYVPLGYGIQAHGSQISISDITATNCRHCIDGSSRSSFMVGVSVTGCKLSKGESDDSHFYYAVGFHANSRAVNISNNFVSGIGHMISIRGGEGVVANNTIYNKYTTSYSDIVLLEEGIRSLVISNNEFIGEASTCIEFGTDQANRNINITGNVVKGTGKDFIRYKNRGFDTRNVNVSNNTGLVQKVFIDEQVSGAATLLDINFLNNEFESSNAVSGFFLGFTIGYTDLKIKLRNNDFEYLTSGGLFGCTATVSGDLNIVICNTYSPGSLNDSFVITPVSVGGNYDMTFTGNEFNGQFELDVTAATYGHMLIAQNKAVGRDDPFLITTADLPISFRDNIVNDANSCRFWKTSLNKHTGNVNYGGLVSINNLNSFSIVIRPDGRWYSIDDTFLSAQGTWEAGDIVYARSPAIGSPMGYICTVGGGPGATTWRPLANVA